MKDISRDFIHLSQAISTYDVPIPYELLVILENCLEDASYRRLAEENLIAFLSTNDRIKAGLENIVNDKSGELSHIQSLACEILNKACSLSPKF